jgi:hypothetical protein
MKKAAALFLLMITISSLAYFPTSARPIHNLQMTKKQTEKIVCLAKDKTYHRTYCKHKSFKNQTTLNGAQKKNYTPCKVCNP